MNKEGYEDSNTRPSKLSENNNKFNSYFPQFSKNANHTNNSKLTDFKSKGVSDKVDSYGFGGKILFVNESILEKEKDNSNKYFNIGSNSTKEGSSDYLRSNSSKKKIEEKNNKITTPVLNINGNYNSYYEVVLFM